MFEQCMLSVSAIVLKNKHCSVLWETFSRCLNCRASLRGLWETPGVINGRPRNYTKPFYCYECGAPYPWTQNILDNAVELLSLDDDLDEISKDLIKGSNS